MRPADNPFRAQRIDALSFRAPEELWSAALERFERLRWAGAVVGPHGHGKSTALRRLGEHLELAGRSVRSVRADREPRLGRWLRRADPEVVFLLDGVERLGRLGRRQVLSRARRYGSVVVTLHEEGFLPTCLRCRTDLDLLAGLVDELLEGVVPGAHEALPELLERHRGNLRRCLFELFDRWPALAQPMHRS